MGDTDDRASSTSAAPEWQQQQDDSAKIAEEKQPTHQVSQSGQLEIARRFLSEDVVKSSSRDKKVEFLKSKGVSDDDIEQLLGQSNDQLESSRQEPKTETDHAKPALRIPANDRPPIVTYPEFLLKPKRPPPLVTKDGLFDTLYAFAGIATLLYGTSKYFVAPMVDSLTDARAELHDAAAQKLNNVVARLEKSVSVVPKLSSRADEKDEKDASDVEDPTEMFHRDVGTQTSHIDINVSSRTETLEPASRRHADQLAHLTKSISVLKDQFRAQNEDFLDVKTLLDVLRDDVDGMTYGGSAEFVGGYDIYGAPKKNEPEDEIRKVRDNIRRVKGVLLSSRSFPASSR